MVPPPAPSGVPVVVVLGGGTAGFLSALAVRRQIPEAHVRVIRSKDIGIIGVGEGTTVGVVQHLHSSAGLGLPVGDFYKAVNPIWKLGIKYLWGPRGSFNYAFGFQLVEKLPLPRPLQYYLTDGGLDLMNESASLMSVEKTFVRHPETGLPQVTRDHAYHLENHAFVAYLESMAVRAGVVLIDDTVVKADVGEHGIRGLHLASGRVETGLIYFDCSGFRSELLSRALNEPFVSYKKTLFCDRAVVGGWERGPDEPIQSYTTAQTMDAGWSWRIDHEHLINRGYVYCPEFISDEQAETEFRRKNPKVRSTRVVRFRSGRYERFWVKNVAAIGNASGFVEPMEATAIAAICDQTMSVTKAIANARRVTPTMQSMANARNADYWDCIPRFLAAHYKFNTLLDTPFWRAIWADMDLSGGQPLLDYYRQNGPDMTYAESILSRHDQFGLGSYYVMFLGQDVPYHDPYKPSAPELELVQKWKSGRHRRAAGGLTAEESLQIVRRPEWAWTPGFYDV